MLPLIWGYRGVAGVCTRFAGGGFSAPELQETANVTAAAQTQPRNPFHNYNTANLPRDLLSVPNSRQPSENSSDATEAAAPRFSSGLGFPFPSAVPPKAIAAQPDSEIPMSTPKPFAHQTKRDERTETG